MSAAEQLITENLAIWSSAIQAKSAAGRGKSNKLELYGIKKLRELILELAVRGLLAPQDPNDEPASELLKKIAAEKAKLLKEGKIKKQKVLPPIEETEKSFELPYGWDWGRLGEVGIVASSSRVHKKEWQDDGVPFYRAREIVKLSQFGFVDNELYITEELFEQHSENGLVPECGDVMMTGVGTIGVPYVVPENAKFYFKDASVLIFKNYWNLFPSFLYYFMKSPFWNDAIHEGSMGTTVHTLTITRANVALIPVAPLPEQIRIVAKVDELMALCDQLEQQQETSITAHQTLVQTLLGALTAASERDGFTAAWSRIADHFDTLFTTEWSIDQLKQTILQLAVMGKLVPQDPNDEPASELLKKITAEKAQLVKDKKIKKPKVLPEIEKGEQPCELPKGWEWCRLNDMITLMDAGWSPACPPEPSPSDDVWGVLKTTAVQTLEYRENENKLLAKGKVPRPQYEVKCGDILITRAGPKNRVAISCLVENTRPKLMISDKIIRFHLAEIGLSERYVSLCLNAGATAAYLEAAKSGMAESQMNISQDKLKMAPIPLAPLNEQRIIIETIDRLIELFDTLKTRLNTTQTTQIQLADAIVEQTVAY